MNNDAVFDVLKRTAMSMLVGAKTAPKARGIDNIEVIVVYKDTIALLSEKMKEIGEKEGISFFKRDALCIIQSPVMLLLGSKISPINLKKCGMCGFANCDEKRKKPAVPCVFNTGDLGIAIGSAVSVAMDCRVDNRIMFSVGQAAIALKLMGDEIKIIYGIPLSATSKNPFFDRS